MPIYKHPPLSLTCTHTHTLLGNDFTIESRWVSFADELQLLHWAISLGPCVLGRISIAVKRTMTMKPRKYLIGWLTV